MRVPSAIKLKSADRVAITLLFLTTTFTFCKKDSNQPSNTNELMAAVVVSPGNTVNINASGPNVTMGCGVFGGGTFIQGINSSNGSNALIVMSVFVPTSPYCITSAGTYNFSCQYRPNSQDPNTPIYDNTISSNRGSITFTKFTDREMEGFFNAVCVCFSNGCVPGVDSVIINGTFKGTY